MLAATNATLFVADGNVAAMAAINSVALVANAQAEKGRGLKGVTVSNCNTGNIEKYDRAVKGVFITSTKRAIIKKYGVSFTTTNNNKLLYAQKLKGVSDPIHEACISISYIFGI